MSSSWSPVELKNYLQKPAPKHPILRHMFFLFLRLHFHVFVSIGIFLPFDRHFTCTVSILIAFRIASSFFSLCLAHRVLPLFGLSCPGCLQIVSVCCVETLPLAFLLVSAPRGSLESADIHINKKRCKTSKWSADAPLQVVQAWGPEGWEGLQASELTLPLDQFGPFGCFWWFLMYMHVYVCMDICIVMYVYVNLWICVYMYVCM